jgi:Family of unknown function (DUF6188)
MGQIIHATETTASAIDASWFRGATLSSIELPQQYVWWFRFSTGAVIMVECLWRILARSIVLTSEDHQHKFGLPVPLDALGRASELLVGDTVTGFVLHEDSLDLVFSFSRGHRLNILPTSAGYEAWQIVSPQRQHIIATGGGRLDTYTDET